MEFTSALPLTEVGIMNFLIFVMLVGDLGKFGGSPLFGICTFPNLTLVMSAVLIISG